MKKRVGKGSSLLTVGGRRVIIEVSKTLEEN